MSCSLKFWNTTAIEVPNNIDYNIKCKICKNNIIKFCVDCETNDNKKNCQIVKGICGCNYHNHCIDNWLEINNNCPDCEILWKKA